MTGPDIWGRLGIAPTEDDGAIRAAYAERLKQVRPDDDPEGFRLLRQAFEAARQARRLSAQTVRPAALPSLNPRVRAPRPPDPVPAPPEVDPAARTREAIDAAVAQGRPIEAARLWAANEARFTLDEAERMQTEIAAAVVSDNTIPLEALNEAAALMRWTDAANLVRAKQPILDVQAKCMADAWWAELQAAAKAPFCWHPARQFRNRAARILLLPAPGRIRWRFPYIFLFHDLTYWLIAWPRHSNVLRGYLGAHRVFWCQAALTRWDARWVIRLWKAWLLCLLLATLVPLLLAILDLF